MQSTSPSLVLTKQTSVSEDKVTLRGKTYSVFFVVKNSPFQITVALKNWPVSLKLLAFDLTLIYDLPEEKAFGSPQGSGVSKEVVYVSTKPVDYKSIINDVGDEISFDAKISALSSQHEDSFFRLKISVWDPNPNSPNPLHLTTLSHSIKVISKPINTRKNTAKKSDQPRRRSSAKNSTVLEKSPPYSDTAVLQSQTNEKLDKLEIQQQQTLQLLHQILSRTIPGESSVNLSQSNSPSIESPIDPFPETRPTKRIKMEYPSPDYSMDQKNYRGQYECSSLVSEFDRLFYTMLHSYSLLVSSDKTAAMGHILRSLSSKETAHLEELFESLRTGQNFDHYLNHLPYGGFLVPDNCMPSMNLSEQFYET